MQRMGTRNDVANAAEHLAGDRAAFVSGQHLLVTGVHRYRYETGPLASS